MLPKWETNSPTPRRQAPKRSKEYLFVAFSIFIFFWVVIVYTPLLENYSRPKGSGSQGGVTVVANDETASPGKSSFKAITLEGTDAKYAFATFLAGKEEKPGEDMSDDPYFVATRMLTYQLLHDPETRSDLPFIVMVTPKVSQKKRERLQRDGAIVVEAAPITGEWIHPSMEQWADVLSKLRLWELTQFKRIAFVDADTILLRRIDGVFRDPAVMLYNTGSDLTQMQADEASLPQDFLFAGVPEMNHEHAYPPTVTDYPNVDYFNAGFFVLKPSLDLLDYYTSLLSLEDRFNSEMPEQNLLNYAHRREGNMPWQQLSTIWNVHYPTAEDVAGGVYSIHEKWWYDAKGLSPLMRSVRWKMEGYFLGMDEALSRDL